MDTNGKRASTLREFCARNNVSRSFAYDEHKRGRLIITKAGKKSLILDEHERAWRDALPALETTAPQRLLEELGAANDCRDALDLAYQLVVATAKMSARERERFVEHFNDLRAERGLDDP